MSLNISTFYKRSVAAIKRISSKASKGFVAVIKRISGCRTHTTTWSAKVGFCDDFVLLTKKEVNMNASGYRNARVMNMSAFFIWDSHGCFSKITQTYIVRHNGFFFFLNLSVRF